VFLLVYCSDVPHQVILPRPLDSLLTVGTSDERLEMYFAMSMEVFACAKTLAARAARMHFSARSLVKCVGYAIVLLGTCCRNNGASSRVRLAAGGASWGILRPHSFALVIMRCQTIEEARIPKNNSKAVC